MIIRLLTFGAALLAAPAVLAQPVNCPQFFPGGQPPALLVMLKAFRLLGRNVGLHVGTFPGRRRAARLS